jgi:ubiquinol-cytochrome c reductase cytochrome b subunit
MNLNKFRGFQFRPFKVNFYIFIANFLVLMQLVAKHVETPFIEIGQLATLIYFLYFLSLLPLGSLLETTLLNLSFKVGSYLSLDSLELSMVSFISISRGYLQYFK